MLAILAPNILGGIVHKITILGIGALMLGLCNVALAEEGDPSALSPSPADGCNDYLGSATISCVVVELKIADGGSAQSCEPIVLVPDTRRLRRFARRACKISKKREKSAGGVARTAYHRFLVERSDRAN